MTFIQDESGIETSRPREIYQIDLAPNAITPALFRYRIASGKYDILYGGYVYKAYPVNRADQEVPTLVSDTAFQLSLPLVHDLPRRWLQSGVPPDIVTVQCRRLQLNSGEADIIWSGVITSMTITGHTAMFQIQSVMQRQMKRRLPVYVVSKNCQHVLYGPNCKADPGPKTYTMTISYVNGRDIKVSYVPVLGDATYFLEGDLSHNITGQKRTIKVQDGQDFSNSVHMLIQSVIPEMRVGDTVVLRAGCNHQPSHCYGKFDNIGNYGGFPDLPPANAFVQNLSTGT